MQTAWNVRPGANGVTLRNVMADGAVYITGASNVSVLGGQVYSLLPVKSDSQIASFYGKVPTNILFDGVSFHDFQDVGPGNVHHIECLQVGSAINLTVRNSSFRNCATHDIFIRSWGTLNNSPHPLSNIVIQNNSFAKTTSGYYAMQVMDDQWTGSAADIGLHPQQHVPAVDPCPGHERDRAGAVQLPPEHVDLLLQLVRPKQVVRLQHLWERRRLRAARHGDGRRVDHSEQASQRGHVGRVWAGLPTTRNYQHSS